MATKRISAGLYEVNGKRVNANSAAEAEKKAGGGKKDTPDKKQDPNAPKPIKFDKDQNTIYKGVKGGQDLSNRLGFDKPLSRVSTDTPEDRQRLIESIRQLSDPSSEAFVGRRSGEEKDALGRLRDISDTAGDRSPEEDRALTSLEEILNSAGKRSGDTSSLLDRFRTDMDTRGQRTGEMTENLASLKARAATAGNRSEQMAETLALMKGGLAGLNAAENQGMREQAQREVDRKTQAATEAVQNAARASGMRGGNVAAGMRNARRDGMMAQGDLEQKNMLANIGIQDSRRKAYGDTLSAQESSEFDRARMSGLDYGNTLSGAEAAEDARYAGAASRYGDTLSNTERNEFDQRATASRSYASGVNDYTSNRYGRMTNAANAYGNQVNTLGNNERERVRNSLSDYGGALGDRDNYFMDATKVNLGQERTDRAAATSAALGLAGLTENEKARRRALKGTKRRGVGDGRTAGQTTPTDPNQYGGFNSKRDQEYYDEIARIQGGG